MLNRVETDILNKHLDIGVIFVPPVSTPKGQRHKRSRRRKVSPLKKTLTFLYTILVAASALIVGSYAALHFFIKPPEIPTAAPVVDSGLELDSDFSTQLSSGRRDGVYTFALLGSDKSSGSTDTIILVTFDTEEHTIGMVSVPRDTAVQRTWAKYPKINSAYKEGADVLRQELQHTFGIPIDFYIKINLNAFIELVDELDGVDVYIPINMSYDDPYQNLHIHYTKGHHHLNGQQAMEVVRFRHNNESEGGGGYNDEGRSEMQRQVLAALARKVISWNSLGKIKSFLNIFQTHVETNLSSSNMLFFASKALEMDLDTALRQGALEGRGDGVYKGFSWCYVYEEETILPTINQLLNPYRTALTTDDLNLPKPSRYIFNQ